MTRSQASSLPTPENAPGYDSPVDREAHNPVLRWAMHLGLPMGVSLGLHLSLVCTLAFTAWHVVEPREYATGEFEVGVAEAPPGPADSLDWPEQAIMPIGGAAIPEPAAFDASAFSSVRDLKIEPAANPGLGGDESGGFGVGGLGRGGLIGTGGGAGEDGGAAYGSGFGSGGGLGGAGVWGLHASGRTFCYVVDFSGSIIVVVDDLKRELKRSIGRLSPAQSFNVFVFYSTQQRWVTDSFASDMQPARADVKRQFFAWIDQKRPTGGTDPVPGVKRALRMQPDVIFLFSDGYFEDAKVNEITRSNRGVKSRIHCLVFDDMLLQDASGLPRLTEGARRLQRIAEENGGKCKIVTAADVKRQ